MMMKREYRGQRSVTAIADYIRQQKSNPIREVLNLEEINSIDVSICDYYMINNYVWLGKCLFSCPFSYLLKAVTMSLCVKLSFYFLDSII